LARTGASLDKFWNYLNELRTAVILRNTPYVANREYNLGRTENLDSIVVIGQAHIDELIQFVENDKVHIKGIGRTLNPEIEFPLNFEKLGIGVNVITPNNLIEN